MLHPHPLMFARSHPTIVTDNGPSRVFGVPQYLPRMFGHSSDPVHHHPIRVFNGGPSMFGQLPLPSPNNLGGYIPDQSDRNNDAYNNSDDFKLKLQLKSPDCHYPKCPSFNLTNRRRTTFSIPSPDCMSEERKSVTPTLNDTTKKTFLCPQCKYTTDRKNNLKRHIITMHFDCDRKLECCGSSFRSKAKLREHVTLFHKNGYRCSTCGRVFCRKALLRRHMTVHSGKKDYHCNTCSYATSHKSNLERHQKVHNKFATTPGMYVSRKFNIRSTSKMRKTFFEQYRQSIFNRQYFQEIRRKRAEQQRDGAQEDKHIYGSQIDEYKTELTQCIAVEKTDIGAQREQNFNNEDNVNEQGHMLEKRVPAHLIDGGKFDIKTQQYSGSDRLNDDSALLHFVSSKDPEHFSEYIQHNKHTNLNENRFSETKVQADQINCKDFKGDHLAPLDTGGMLEELDFVENNENLSKEGADKYVRYFKDLPDPTGLDRIEPNFDKKQIVNKGITKVSKVRRRLCDKPYRCSNCCARFKHQVTSVKHMCSHMDAHACLQSISLVTRINKRWITCNPR